MFSIEIDFDLRRILDQKLDYVLIDELGQNLHKELNLKFYV